MALIQLSSGTFAFAAREAAKRPFGLALSSLIAAVLYFIYNDFIHTYVRRPSHFVRKSFKQLVSKEKFDCPVEELQQGETYREVLARGSAKYPDRPYKIRHFPGEIVILPQNCIDDVKDNAEPNLSFQQGSYDFFVGDFTGITGHEKATATLIRRDVGRLLDRVYEIVQEAALNAILEEIGECNDWTEIVLFPRIAQMIIKISQRVFVGEPLCSNPEWLEAIANCTGRAFGSVPKLWEYNPLIRPFAAWMMKDLRAVRGHKDRAKELLKPILDQRLEDMKDPNFKSPPDMIQLVIDGSPGDKGRDINYQLEAQIGTGRAALFTTAATCYHLLYDLCVRSEYVEPLRQEALEVGEVKMTRANVAKLVKLDSFIREAQRFNKFMLVGTIRKVAKPLKIKTGDTLPVGTITGVDTHTFHFTNSTLENPDEFDGFRYVNLRQIEGNEGKFQAVTTGADHLVYGYGQQACPGRFFAMHEAKVVVSRILRNYEFKLKEQPKAMSVMAELDGILNKVDPSVAFMFKKRDKSNDPVVEGED